MPTVPLKMLCSTKFGRYPKISIEQVFNMFQSDGWMLNHSGYESLHELLPGGKGRGIFYSSRSDSIYAVVDNKIYRIVPDPNFFQSVYVASLESYAGNVYIDENLLHQIAFCDQKDIYILDYALGSFTKLALDFSAGYITFQDSRFVASVNGLPQWRLSDISATPGFTPTANQIGVFQTKPDECIACVRMPGKTGTILVMGKTVTEVWQDVGLPVFPYQRSVGYNIDYGCLSAGTIAQGEDFVVWLGSNEKSGIVIMSCTGQGSKQLSNDGINRRLSQLSNPEESFGFLFKQSGHLFYQITFSNPADNLTLTYDFNTGLFFTLTDHKQNCHIAKNVCYAKNGYYFISYSDGNFYQLGDQFTTYDGEEIPRIIITAPITDPNREPFVINSFEFPIEQGQNKLPARVDVSVSADGGLTFSNGSPFYLNQYADRQNRFKVFNVGRYNEATFQFRFWSYDRVLVSDGVMEILE